MSFPQQPQSPWGSTPSGSGGTGQGWGQGGAWSNPTQSTWSQGGWQQAGTGPAPYGTGTPAAGQHAPYGTGHPAQGHPAQGQPTPGRPATAIGARRRNPLAVVLLVMLGLVAASIVTLVIVGLVNANSGVRYANADYTPPPPNLQPEKIPVPTSLDEAVQWTNDNALYRQTMPEPIRCELPVTDYPSLSDQEKEAFLNEFVGCLMTAWDPTLQQAGFTMPRPSVTVYDPAANAKSVCGDLVPNNASYCSLDQQVYVANDLEDIPLVGAARRGAEFVLAHEFGHAIQGRTGIIMARIAQMQVAATDADAYTINRRLEAQADCFAGLYMRAASRSMGIDETDVEEWQAMMEQLGGSKPGKTHPSGVSRVYWSSIGLSTADIGKCNTFTAPDSTVR